MRPDADSHFLYSSLREKVVEHLFLGELLRSLWLSGARRFGVLRPEVDDCGYDLVIECAEAVRHVQLKASHLTAKTAYVPVNVGLTRVPSGCVLWVLFDPETLKLGPFLWLGGSPSIRLTLDDLGGRVGRHTRAGQDGIRGKRPNIRSVPRTRFDRLETMSDVAAWLFGA